jgi:hypothetical protein
MRRDLEAYCKRFQNKSAAQPTQLDKPDFERLTKMVIEYVEAEVKEHEPDSDYPHYIYEIAVEAVYGDTFWAFSRARGR